MAYNPRHDLDGETLGLNSQMRTLTAALRARQAEAAELRRQEDDELKSTSVFGQPVLDLIVRTYGKIRDPKDNK